MTSVYLTSAAADAAVTAGSGTKWKADWAAGASSRLLNKNTAAAPASALQVTDSATAGTDGTVVSWYTEPLWGVTIAGQIICLVWTRESATSANVAPTIRIERCDGAGNVLSTIVAENTNQGAGEMGTTAGGATDSITCTAANVADTTLSDGDRLRITLFIDNAADHSGTGTMASGANAQFYVNGPNGAAGQAQIQFTEVVAPQAGPKLVTSPETSFTTTTTPKTLTAVGALSGDLMVAMYGGDNFSGAASSATVTTTGGTTGAWTEVLEALVGTTDSPWKSNAWANVTADGDATASLARVQGTPQVWGGWLAHIRNHGGIGNTAELVDSASDSVSLTTSENSMVLALGIDWDHVTPVTAFTPSGAHDIERNAGLTAVTWYAGFWVGQPAGTRNYGIATNSSTSFSLTVIEILAPSGSTPVGKNLQLVWDTRAALGDPLQLVWNTRAAVGKDLGLPWNVRIPVGKEVQALWNVRQAVGKSVQALWNTKAPAGKDLSLLWNVRTPVSKTLQTIWNVRTFVGDDLQLIWNVKQAIGDPLQLVWNTKQAVGDDLQLVWDTQSGTVVGKSLQLLWDTRAPVGDPLQLVWNTRASVGDPLDLRWNVRAALGEDLSLLWNTRAAVGDPLQLVWNTRTFVGDPLQLVWNTRVAVGDPLQLVWNTRAAAGKSLQLVWDVQIIGATAVGKSLALVWNTRQALGDALDLRWNTRALAADELSLLWDARSAVGDSLDLRWGIRTTVGKSGIYLWSVRSVAGKDLILLWDVESVPYIAIQDPVVVVVRNPASGSIVRNSASGAMGTSATARVRPNNTEARPL
jgi:hypothetical protein